MELGHLPYRKRTFEDYVGQRGLERFGFKKWQKLVFDIIDRMRKALEPDYIVLGGGNVKRLTEVPEGCRIGNNANAFIGGFRLWDSTKFGDNGARNDESRNGGHAAASENDQPKQGTKA
jgi:polyphosphate glucokinase